MRITQFALVFVLTLVVRPAAQTAPSMSPGTKGTLVKLSDNKEKPVPAIRMCGDYFLDVTPEGSPDGMARVTFAIDANIDGKLVTTLQAFAIDKLRVRLDERTKVPTATILRSGGPVYPWTEITLSSDELKRSSCLKKVSIVM